MKNSTQILLLIMSVLPIKTEKFKKPTVYISNSFSAFVLLKNIENPMLLIYIIYTVSFIVVYLKVLVLFVVQNKWYQHKCSLDSKIIAQRVTFEKILKKR